MLNEQTMLESKVNLLAQLHWLLCLFNRPFLKAGNLTYQKSTGVSALLQCPGQCDGEPTPTMWGPWNWRRKWESFLFLTARFLTVTCRDRIRVTFRNYEPGFWKTPQTFHTCMYTEQQHSEVKMCPPVCVSTLCFNFFFPVCVHVWVCVRHSAVCFTSCAPGRVITHLCAIWGLLICYSRLKIPLVDARLSYSLW